MEARSDALSTPHSQTTPMTWGGDVGDAASETSFSSPKTTVAIFRGHGSRHV